MIRCRWGMRGFALFVVGLLGLNLAAQPYNPAGQAQWRRSVASQAAFAFNLYRVLDEDAPEANLLYSPYSLYLALSMAYEGARGNTAAEMGEVLFSEGGYDEGLRSATLASFRDIAQRTAEDAGSGAVLRSASRLYGDGSCQPPPSWPTTTARARWETAFRRGSVRVGASCLARWPEPTAQAAHAEPWPT